jgi:hypothetical protein
VHHRYDPHIEWSRTQGAVTVIDKVIGTAEENARLRNIAGGPRDREHRPRPPLDFSRRTASEAFAEDEDVDDEGDVVIESGQNAAAAAAEVDQSGDVRTGVAP